MIKNNKKELSILFLASWYPSDQDPVSGIFIQRHAEAVARFSNVIILFIRYDETIKHRELMHTYENGIHTFRMNIPVDLKSFIVTRNIKNRLINNFFINALYGYNKIVKKFGTPDIIQVNVMKTTMTDMGLFALLIRSFLGIPYVVVEHSNEYLTNIIDFFTLLKVRMILKYAKIVLPVSTILKNSLKSIQNNNYMVVKNVVDTDFFILPKIVHEHQTKIILHVSLLDDFTKNVSGIIQAVSELRKIRNDFELHIVGDGVDKKTLENLAMNLQGNTQYIFFSGALMSEELVKKYQEADVFILNSIQETFGCVVIEALSCGVPVISTRCGGPEDIITPETGILIDLNDKKQLIDAIQLILNKKCVFKPEIMHNYVVNNFGFYIIGKSLMSIYHSIVK